MQNAKKHQKLNPEIQKKIASKPNALNLKQETTQLFLESHSKSISQLKLSFLNKNPNLYKFPYLMKVMPKKEISKNTEMNKALIDNFINLQKVMTNLAVKFDELSRNIEKLLQLFEISAKSFAEKNLNIDDKQRESDTDLLKKLDSLLDQNKTISKGITMMEERIRNRPNSPPTEGARFTSRPRPFPRY